MAYELKLSDNPPMTLRQPATRRRARGAPTVPSLPLDAPAPVATFAALATERLKLRPLALSDAEALHRLVNDSEVHAQSGRGSFSLSA